MLRINENVHMLTSDSNSLVKPLNTFEDNHDDDDDDSMDEWIAFKENLFKNIENSTSINDNDLRPGYKPNKRRRKPMIPSNMRTNQFLVAYNRLDNLIAITFVGHSRTSIDIQSNCMAVCLSPDELIELNNDLCLVSAKFQAKNQFEPIKRLLEQFSMDNHSTYYYIRYLFGWTTSNEDVIRLEMAIKNYLETIVEQCGIEILRPLLFERKTFEDFEENCQQLRLQSHENFVEQLQQELKSIIALRKQASNLLSINELYKIEDQIVDRIFQALDELYLMQLRPFLRMRELSSQRLEQLDSIIECKYLGPKLKEKSINDRREYNEFLLSSTSAIQQLYVDYFGRLVAILSGQIARAMTDQKRYGRNAIEQSGASIRLERLRRQMFLKKIEHLNCRKLSLKTNEYSINSNKQQIIEINLEILVQRQSLLRLDLAALLSNNDRMNGGQSIDFFDAVQSSDEFHLIDEQISQQNELIQSKINVIKRKMALNAQKQAKLRLELKKFKSNRPVVDDEPTKTCDNQNAMNKMKKFQRETYLRLKRYRMKQLLNEQQRKIDGKYSESDDEFHDCIDDSVRMIACKSTIPKAFEPSLSMSSINSNPSPCPSSSPPPPVIPSPIESESCPSSAAPMPPPPPPPPPPPSFDLSLKPLVLQKSSKSDIKPKSDSNSQATIRLDEILQIRQKLRSIKDRQEDSKTKDFQGSNQFENILKSTMKQIRQAVDDDTSMSEDDSYGDSFAD